MKLLMISGDRLTVQGKKGAFWYTLEEFSKHWDRIDVICPTSTGQNIVLFGNVHFHPSPWSLLHQSAWINQKGKELINQYHHDVMTVHEYPPYYNGMGAVRLAKATGTPYAVEIHHIVGYPVASSWHERVGYFLSRFYLRHDVRAAKAVRTVNGEVKQVLSSWGVPDQKIAVVPSFYLDTEALQSDATVEKTYDLVFCARLVANKGLHELLAAVAALPGMSLLVIGDGPERLRAESFVKKSAMQDRVTFTGWLPTQADVIRALQTAHVFVMNSHSEGGPRVALEAMALGLPVVATRVGVMPDVVRSGENGILIGPKDDLKSVLCRVLSADAERVRMGKEARKIAETFERKKLVKGYAEFLKGLIDK